MVTRLRALQSAVVPDPTKKSASYVPAQPALLFSLRSTDEGRGIFPGRTVLANPVAKRYVNPRELGFVAPVPVVTLPRIVIELPGVDFNGSNGAYDFPGLPPGADFEVVVLNDPGESPPDNLDQITSIFIYDTSDPPAETFGSVTIATSPAWPGSSFTSSVTQPALDATAGTYPGFDTVITFRNVPVIANLRIQFYGNTPPP
jgi:hypothetical protein